MRIFWNEDNTQIHISNEEFKTLDEEDTLRLAFLLSLGEQPKSYRLFDTKDTVTTVCGDLEVDMDTIRALINYE